MREPSPGKRHWAVAVCVGLLLCCMVGGAKVEQESREADGRIASANATFGFKLFAKILESDPGKNVFASPASVAMALAMVFNGASGETQQAVAKTLEVEGMALEDLNRANAALKAALENADPKVQLFIANSLWARKGVRFTRGFMQRNKEFYAAEVSTLDFGDPEAVPTINAWVSKNTKDKIAKIVESPMDPQLILFLINAVYFKGTWTRPFDKEVTEERPFNLLNGTQKQCPMMQQAGMYNYLRGEKFQAVSLPYGQRRLSMYVFLPDKDSSLTEFCRNLTADTWEKWMAQFRRLEGGIVLPRFKVEYETLLNESLKALGMGIALDPSRADFGAMTREPAFISQVKHKTFVEVNEEGTEAAAVTAIGLAMAAPPTEPVERFDMVVDRPFFFAIRDNTTGTVLFMGAIVDPRAQ